jgi:hypothetical protein
MAACPSPQAPVSDRIESPHPFYLTVCVAGFKQIRAVHRPSRHRPQPLDLQFSLGSKDVGSLFDVPGLTERSSQRDNSSENSRGQ